MNNENENETETINTKETIQSIDLKETPEPVYQVCY